MARRQQQIPGTEVAGTTEETKHPEIQKATDELCAARSRRKAETKRLKDIETQKESELIAILKLKKIPLYVFKDDENEEVEVELEETWKVHVRKNDVVDSDVGEGVPGSGEAEANAAGPGIHPGLVAQAEKDQAASGNAEVDGDVVPNEIAAAAKKKAK